MSQTVSTHTGIADRYTSALFDLALESKKLTAVEKDLAAFDKILNESDDLTRMVRSPVYSTEDQSKGIGAVLDKAGIGGIVGNFLRVVAANRRAFVMPQLLSAFRKLLAEHKGEITAQVSVATKLTAAQTKELKAALKSAVGKDVALDVDVDPSLLGGMIVKVGSRQIDTSLKTKLSTLKLALKEDS